jgi:hypothetical protein
MNAKRSIEGRKFLAFGFYFSLEEDYVKMTCGFSESRMFANQEKAFNAYSKLLVFGFQHIYSSQI